MNAKLSSDPKVLIEFRDVVHRNNNLPNRAILDDISLPIYQGETVILLGRSGSGKTTLLKHINRMLLPSRGQVFVEGRTTTDWDPIRLRRHIGYVIQEGGLFPHLTARGQIVHQAAAQDQRITARVEELLRLVGLESSEFSHRHPGQLSGGQRQRIGVARALAADPPILLMDEPFGALDPVTRSELQREFAALAGRLGKTIVFVTHDLREALLLGSRIILLESGSIVADASPQEFLKLAHPEVRAFTASLAVSAGMPA